MTITYERVKELFAYNGSDLIWNVTKQRVQKGSIAGHINPYGYRVIGIDYGLYRAHRLVWLYHYGYFPEHQIDHINRDKTDNRIGNLREVSQSCNLRNCGNQKNNKSGVKGVTFNKSHNGWDSHSYFAGKSYFLGCFKDFDEAVLLRYAAEQCLDWGSCDKMSPAHKYALENNLVSK